MKILKFGGKSLTNGIGIQKVITTIEQEIKNKQTIFIVLSARANTTSQLNSFLNQAKNGQEIEEDWKAFKNYQVAPLPDIDFKNEFKLLEDILKGVKLTHDFSLKTRDLVLAQGELMAAKLINALLLKKQIKSCVVDSRQFLKTDGNHNSTIINQKKSLKLTLDFFNNFDKNTIPVIPGFIASNQKNETITIGRNGSNYTAALLANFLDAKQVNIYTDVNGIYSAHPKWVRNTKVIEQINYIEANELTSFGTSILHAKSISPLADKNIPLRILNIFDSDKKGTLINNEQTKKGIKAIAVKENVCLINIEGKGLLGKKGVDARIFSSLSNQNISIGIISQGSTERGVSFIIPEENITIAIQVLNKEFEYEILANDIHAIKAIKEVSVVTIVGQNIVNFSNSLKHLAQNNIDILLINNTLSGNNISLVLKNKDTIKAVNIIHSQIFGVIKNINIAVFGKGTVGGSFINQILNSRETVLEKKNIHLNIFAIVGTKSALLSKDGIDKSWREAYEKTKASGQNFQDVLDFADKHHLENLVAIDNTTSDDFVKNYIPLVENGFNLISSNKIANTQDYKTYQKLRKVIKQNHKQYLYETNVGAGLPIIDTIRILHESGENITRIRGVFSGTLSFLFNEFSKNDIPFSVLVKKAMKLGYTEPDPREDLNGNDVGRKLLILARELDLENEFKEVVIENLIPKNLRTGSVDYFLSNIEQLDSYYDAIKKNLKEGEVIRYLADLSGDLSNYKGKLSVKLSSVPAQSALGNLSGSDTIFEIFTSSYGENPISIIGAGAGAEVTARGVFGDLLRIAEKT